jgi:hypothetical protein
MPFGPPGSLADIGPQILMAALQRQRQNPLMPSAPDQNAPVRPDAPPAPGDPAYVQGGGQGPAMGTGGAAPTGLLGMLMQRMQRGMAGPSGGAAPSNPLAGLFGGGGGGGGMMGGGGANGW